MTGPVLSADEMLAWTERTAAGWEALFTEHPEALGLPCDIYGVRTVGELLQHMVAVELRYAQRLAGVAESPYEEVPCGAAGELFAVHRRAMEMLREELGRGGDWETSLEFVTISSGRVRSKRKTVFFHALLHTMRHSAQLATLLRQHGYKPGWSMDYLGMQVERL